MYKFIVSCYYWPVFGKRLRLRSLRVKPNQRKSVLKIPGLPSVKPTSVISERRQVPRLKTICEVELTASLAILDRDAHPCSETLLFYGRTSDLSVGGLSVVLPATQIDDRFCGDWARLELSLFLPTGSVRLEVNPVRWQLLHEQDTRLGYLMGAQILRIDDNRNIYNDYLRSISNLTFDN